MARLWCAAVFVALVYAEDEFRAIDGFRDYEFFVGQGAVADAEAQLQLTVVCEREGIEDVTAAARAVSDPGNESYGQYWAHDDVLAAVRVSAACSASVENWLSGITAVNRNADGSSWRLSLPVSAAERLFSTKFTLFKRAPHPPFHRATTPVLVPRCVAGVLGVHGLPYPLPSASLEAPRTPVLSDSPVNPAFIQHYYSVSGRPAGVRNQSRALVEIGGGQINENDVSQFFSEMVPGARPGDDVVSRFQGTPYVPSNGSMSQSDIEYLMGVAPGVPTEMWLYQADGGLCSSLLAWLDDANNVNKSGNVTVFALTGGWQGDPSVVGCTDALMQRVEDELSKIAARGLTVIAASGDGGSGVQVTGCTAGSSTYYDATPTSVTVGTTAYSCCQLCATKTTDCTHWTVNTTYSNTSTPSVECLLFKGNVTEKPAPAGTSWFPVSGKAPGMAMYASWPASSMFVTAVGATSITGGSEVASTSFGSGGGFARGNAASRPQWQITPVRMYFSRSGLQLPPEGTYPPGNRGIPDLALTGSDYEFISFATAHTTSGTAVAAAVFASMVSYLNDLRIQRGKPVLGHLNPLLYNQTTLFTDVTVGGNQRDSFGRPLPIGWLATQGWDPVTGLGSPKFSEMVKVLT